MDENTSPQPEANQDSQPVAENTKVNQPPETPVPQPPATEVPMAQPPAADTTPAQPPAQVIEPQLVPPNPTAQPIVQPQVQTSQPAQPTPLPVQPQPKKSHKKLFIILAIALVGLLAVGGAAGFYIMTKPTPTKRLQQAIINMGSTGAIKQVFTSSGDDPTLGGTMKITATAESDFSNPSTPKTKGTYKINLDADGMTMNIENEFVCVSEKECYTKYTTISSNPQDILANSGMPPLSKWLKFDPANDPNLTADPFQIIKGINTVTGEVIMGNITGESKTKIVEAAKNNSTYTFSESVKDQGSYKYKMSLNKTQVIDLNKVVAKQYNIAMTRTASDLTDSFTAWIDTKTNQFKKVEFEKDGVKSSVEYSVFSKSPSITAPDSYLNPSQYDN